MENAVDALKMAGSVLLFVLALSMCVLNFSQAREAVDSVLQYSDREYSTIEGDSRFYYLADSTDKTSRYVGKETIIPAIYRSYRENYKIIFKFKDDNYYLYKDKDGNDVKKIDLETNVALANDAKKEEFINGILYKDFNGKTKENFYKEFGITDINNTSLNDHITTHLNDGNSIKELLGTYNQEDIKSGEDTSTPSTNPTSQDRIITMTTEKRVITYEFT